MDKELAGKGSRLVKFTVYLEPETHKALRIRAIEEDTSATELVERLLVTYLKSREGKGRK